MIVWIQSHNFKFYTIDITLKCVWKGSERRKTNVQINRYMKGKSQSAVTKLSINRRTTEFFVGWMKRLGNTMILFEFPLNKKEHPDL